MFKKLMAKFGVGAANVDLRLDQEAYRLGEKLNGMIHIEGGAVEQRISQLRVDLMMRAYVKGREVTHVVTSFPVLHHFVVQPKPFVQEVEFHYELPHDLAISTPYVQYFLQTVLDVEQAVDPTDLDRVTLLAPVHLEQVFQALQRLDFRPNADFGKLTSLGQEFSFFPGRPFSVPLNELEIAFLDTSESLRLLVELDVPQFGGFYREREQKAEITIPRELLTPEQNEELASFLRVKLEECLTNPQAVPYFSTSPYLHRSHHRGHSMLGHGGRGLGGMVGGLAAGFLGGMLIEEMIDGAQDMDLFDGNPFDDGGGFDGGGFDGGDFGDL